MQKLQKPVGNFGVPKHETHPKYLTLITRARLWMATHPLLEKALGIGLPITATTAAILAPVAIHAQERPDAGVTDAGSVAIDLTNAQRIKPGFLKKLEGQILPSTALDRGERNKTYRFDDRNSFDGTGRGYLAIIADVGDDRVVAEVTLGDSGRQDAFRDRFVFYFNGKQVDAIELTSLRVAFEQETGYQMKAVKILVNRKESEMNFYIIPLIGSGQEPLQNTPIMVVPYNTKESTTVYDPIHVLLAGLSP